jgi:hypothetical protein
MRELVGAGDKVLFLPLNLRCGCPIFPNVSIARWLSAAEVRWFTVDHLSVSMLNSEPPLVHKYGLKICIRWCMHVPQIC